MITFSNPHHALHQGQFEMFRGALVPCHEVPARADHVLAELPLRHLPICSQVEAYTMLMGAGVAASDAGEGFFLLA